MSGPLGVSLIRSVYYIILRLLTFFMLYNLFAGFDTTALKIDKIFLVVGPVLKCTLSSTVAGPFLWSSCLLCDVAGLLHR